MSREPRHLERSLERDMELLRALPPSQPPAACLERITTRVAAAARARQRAVRRRPWVFCSSAAAALLLSLSWLGARPAVSASGDPHASLDAWLAALEQSALIVSDGWSPDMRVDDDDVLDDFFKALDAALELGA